MSYNGWENRETWAVNLWITNDQDTYDLVNELIDDPYSEDAIYDLSKELREYIEDMNPLGDDANLFSDLLIGALQEVDWYEIAEHWITDYRVDNPPEPHTYEISLDPRDGRFVVDDPHGPYIDDTDTFWYAFQAAVQDALDTDRSSIVIEWDLEPAVRAAWFADNPIVDQPSL